MAAASSSSKKRKITFRKKLISYDDDEDKEYEADKYAAWLPSPYKFTQDIIYLLPFLKDELLKEKSLFGQYNKSIFRDGKGVILSFTDEDKFFGDDSERDRTIRAFGVLQRSRYFEEALATQKCDDCDLSSHIIWACAVRDCKGHLQRIYIYVIPILSIIWETLKESKKKEDWYTISTAFYYTAVDIMRLPISDKYLTAPSASKENT